MATMETLPERVAAARLRNLVQLFAFTIFMDEDDECIPEASFNSLSASLLLNIFLSFEVGIAHAIANFKWKENTSSLKN